ncbi:MAG: hypothetical protein K6E91_07255 [Butyrivibrio sp.]|nr:hypothetical protein [Butyrivibrio sp.]
MDYKDKNLKKLKDHVDYLAISAEMSRKLAEIDQKIINLMAKNDDIKDKKAAVKAIQDMVDDMLQNAKFRELVKGKNSEDMNMELNLKGKIKALNSL